MMGLTILVTIVTNGPISAIHFKITSTPVSLREQLEIRSHHGRSNISQMLSKQEKDINEGKGRKLTIPSGQNVWYPLPAASQFQYFLRIGQSCFWVWDTVLSSFELLNIKPAVERIRVGSCTFFRTVRHCVVSAINTLSSAKWEIAKLKSGKLTGVVGGGWVKHSLSQGPQIGLSFKIKEDTFD